jgi:hypothetical protein
MGLLDKLGDAIADAIEVSRITTHIEDTSASETAVSIVGFLKGRYNLKQRDALLRCLIKKGREIFAELEGWMMKEDE